MDYRKVQFFLAAARLGNLTEAFINLDAPVGLQLLNQSAKGGTHDSATNQGNIDMLRLVHNLSITWELDRGTN